MKIKLFFFIALSFSLSFLTAQVPQFDWMQKISTPASISGELDIFPIDMVVDGEGNSYHLGSFSSNVLLPNGQVLLLGDASESLYIVKFTPSGGLDWAQTIRSANTEFSPLGFGASIAFHEDGSVYVASYRDENEVFIGNLSLAGVSCVSCEGLFWAKLTANDGVPLYARAIQGNDFTYQQLGGITTDEAGNLYMGGTYDGSTINFGGLGLYNNLAGGGFFLAKINEQTGVEWAEFQGFSSTGTSGISMLEWRNNSIATSGYYDGDIQFGNGVQLENAGATDAFVSLFDAQNGSAQWAQNLNSPDYLDILDIDIDNSGRVYLAIDWAAALNNGSNELAATMEEYGASLLRFSADDVEMPVLVVYNSESYPVNTIAVDDFGNIVGGGYFTEQTINIGGTDVNNSGSIDGLLFAFDDSLDLLWARNFGGPADQGLVNFSYGKSMGFDDSGDLYLNGGFIGGITADALNLAGDGVFAAKLNTGSVSVKDPVVYEGFSIYPNPTSGLFNLVLDKIPASEAQLMLIDQQGREVHRQTVNSSEQRVNVALLPGMYTVKVMSDRGVMVQKLLVAQ